VLLTPFSPLVLLVCLQATLTVARMWGVWFVLIDDTKKLEMHCAAHAVVPVCCIRVQATLTVARMRGVWLLPGRCLRRRRGLCRCVPRDLRRQGLQGCRVPGWRPVLGLKDFAERGRS
jgi:hypothetical protein